MNQKKCIHYANDIQSYPGPSRWCVSCGHKLTSEVYVSCLLCKDIDLCLSCYSQGIDIYPHFKDHPVSVITPSTQPGFEIGWTLREELIFIESLSKEYGFNWENVSNEIGTKNPEECRHHFLNCYIKAKNAPDPRGGSSKDYVNSKKIKFLESNENSNIKINKKETNDSNTETNSNLNGISAPNETLTDSPLHSSPASSTRLSAVSSSSITLTQQQTAEPTNSAAIPLSSSSIFDDEDDMIQFNKFFKKKKNRPSNYLTNGDIYGFSLGRQEFEPDPYDAPEMTTLNIKFDEENETEESFMEKLNILKAYDSVVIERGNCDTSLFKLKSFRDFVSQPTSIHSNNTNKDQIPNQNFNISRSRSKSSRHKGISEPTYHPSKAIPISKFSTIESDNFGLIGVAEDPNEIEEISSIIHDANSFFNKCHINQNDGGTPSGTSLQAAFFQHLSNISFINEESNKEEKEETKEEDQSTEKEENKEDETNEENFKFDDKRDIETDETDEKIKNKSKQETELEETSDDIRKNQSFSNDKKQTKKKNVSASPRKNDSKEKKSNIPIALNINISEKDLRQWNDNAPLAESAHLFDSFYLKFMSKNEINFIKEKKISASLFTKVKNSIMPFIVGNFNKEFILQKVSELYPNFFIEASLITDYFYDSKLYNCLKPTEKS